MKYRLIYRLRKDSLSADNASKRIMDVSMNFSFAEKIFWQNIFFTLSLLHFFKRRLNKNDDVYGEKSEFRTEHFAPAFGSRSAAPVTQGLPLIVFRSSLVL